VQLAVGDAQVEAIDSQRLADLVLQELANRPAVDAAQDLAVDVAEVQRVVGRSLADGVDGLQRRDAARHPIPIGQPVGRVADRRLRHAGLVCERVAQRCRLLAVLSELRPHLHDRHVVAEAVLLDQQVHAS
jgi:hypothetical protein